MRIAVNTRLLLKERLDGIGWFTFETMKRIVRDHPEVEFHFLFDRKFDEEFVFGPNVIPHVLHPQARHPWLFRIWYDYAVARKLKSIGADLFVSPDSILSLTTGVPQLLVIHDLNFEHYPGDLPKIYSQYLRKYSPMFANKAQRICTVSQFSRNDIISLYGVAGNKINVVYNGVNESFVPASEDDKNKVRNEITGGKPYFVFVSSLHPRKNLTRLLLAYDQFRQVTGEKTGLVVIGKKFWLNDEMEQAYDRTKFRNDVIFTGWLPAGELHKVVAAATASLYLSYFEGFGIPILEAFKCGVPVITSNVTSMPEVAGDAALLVDPFSVEEITGAMIRINSDQELRNLLIEKGSSRSLLFSWQRTSELLWESIEQTINKTK